MREKLQSWLQYNCRVTIRREGSLVGRAAGHPQCTDSFATKFVGQFKLSEIANMDQKPLALEFLDKCHGPTLTGFSHVNSMLYASSMARLLETKATLTRGTMAYVPGGEKVPQETKVPFSPLVSRKVLLLLESLNTVKHSATVKASNDCCYNCLPPYIRGRPYRIAWLIEKITNLSFRERKQNRSL